MSDVCCISDCICTGRWGVFVRFIAFLFRLNVLDTYLPHSTMLPGFILPLDARFLPFGSVQFGLYSGT